jgi:hypothetical protein
MDSLTVCVLNWLFKLECDKLMDMINGFEEHSN